MNFKLSQKDFNHWMDTMKDMALSDLVSKPKALVPRMAIIEHGVENEKCTMTLCVLDIEFNEAEEKHTAIFNLGVWTYNRRMFPLAIILLSEAWRSETGIKPSCAPDRSEVLLVFGRNAKGDLCKAINIPVERDTNGNMVQSLNRPEIVSRAESPLLGWFYKGYFSQVMKTCNN